ncbi:hypothetical protein C8N25_12219 [Algoriphagus antarcticus]|uniref:Uncharacterized protein n=1 Tax=Algoriphagus antarcticus TaxID=238540 RepID=A0A3E0DKF8_9BACT|nr:hypothetical protein C8N25_12219 [Algoriphagus antarcticus]
MISSLTAENLEGSQQVSMVNKVSFYIVNSTYFDYLNYFNFKNGYIGK